MAVCGVLGAVSEKDWGKCSTCECGISLPCVGGQREWRPR